MRFLEVSAMTMCLAATLLFTAQGACQVGCNCGIPGSGCGETGQCSASASPETSSTIFVSPPDTSIPVAPGLSSTIYTYTSGPEIPSSEYPYPADQSCPAKPPSEHLVPDPQYYPDCVYKCEDGYQFDEHGDCVELGPYTTSALYTSPPESSGLVTENGEPVRPGDKITIHPGDKITLGAKCREFIKLVKANMGEDQDFQTAIQALAYLRAKGNVTETEERVNEGLWGITRTDYIAPVYQQAIIDLTKCVYTCAKLYEENPQMLHTQSGSKTPVLLGSLGKTSPPAQIGLHLDSGLFLSEVVNKGVSLNIDKATLTVSSMGNNTFGVAYDPNSSVSYVVAYQQPVEIQPKNNSLASFTLNGSHAVIVDAKNVSQIVPLASILDNKTSGAYDSNGAPSNQSLVEPTDSLQKLEQLKKMLDAGLITQEDYNSKKIQILSRI